jgi:Rrf2 family iron-sulfur cluster assembly transcriptional regulator
LWADLSEQIHLFLEGISLADLVAKREVRQISQGQDRRQIIAAELPEAMIM